MVELEGKRIRYSLLRLLNECSCEGADPTKKTYANHVRRLLLAISDRIAVENKPISRCSRMVYLN
jgi:hypothetical protein